MEAKPTIHASVDTDNASGMTVGASAIAGRNNDNQSTPALFKARRIDVVSTMTSPRGSDNEHDGANAYVGVNDEIESLDIEQHAPLIQRSSPWVHIALELEFSMAMLQPRSSG